MSVYWTPPLTPSQVKLFSELMMKPALDAATKAYFEKELSWAGAMKRTAYEMQTAIAQAQTRWEKEQLAKIKGKTCTHFIIDEYQSLPLYPDEMPPPKLTNVMTINGELGRLNDAVPRLEGQMSVVYPGLTAIQALVWITEILLQYAEGKSVHTLVHPKVAERVHQIAENHLGSGPGPDHTVAALFHATHPGAGPAPQLPSSPGIETTTTITTIEVPSKPGKRKFV